MSGCTIEKTKQTMLPDDQNNGWQAIVTKILQPQYVLVPQAFPIENLQALNAGLDLSFEAWIVGMHWLYKKEWNRKHKIPYSPRQAKLLEPIGDYMWAILKLTSDIHALGHFRTKQWENSGQWTGAIFEELLFCATNKGIQKMLQGHGVSTELKFIRDMIKDLKNEQIPKEVKASAQPAFHTLIDLMLQYIRSEKYPNLRDKNLRYSKSHHIYTCKGLVGSLAKYASLLDSPHAQPLHIKNQQLYVATKTGQISIKAS